MPASVYLDASVLVKRYVEEPGTSTVQHLIEPRTFRGSLYLGAHTAGEVISAINRLYRQGHLTKRGHRTALVDLHRDYPSLFHVIPLQPAVLEHARLLLQRYPKLKITNPDAIHLAAATYAQNESRVSPLVFASCDKSLRVVAEREGWWIFNPEHERTSVLREIS